jgi:hypothetical protein
MDAIGKGGFAWSKQMLDVCQQDGPACLGKEAFAWSEQGHPAGRHPASRTMGTECKWVHARAPKSGRNVCSCPDPYSAQQWCESKCVSMASSHWRMTGDKKIKTCRYCRLVFYKHELYTSMTPQSTLVLWRMLYVCSISATRRNMHLQSLLSTPRYSWVYGLGFMV